MQRSRAAAPVLCALLVLPALASAAAGPARAAGPAADYAAPGPHVVSVEYGEFVDRARDRTIPCKTYAPKVLDGRHPVVIFSHGLGGSRDAAGYLGEHLASHGYIALHVQHPGSDATLFEGGRGVFAIVRRLRASLEDPRNAIARFEDIPFVIDRLEAWDRSGRFAGHIDLAAIGMSGHSYGARSTLIAAGERIGPDYASFKDPRIAAAIAYSPNLPVQETDLARAYADIDIPMLHVTGTDDRDPLRLKQGFEPTDRTIPFARIPVRPQYLLVLDGADHMVFSGSRPRAGPRPRDPGYWALTRAASLAFWNAMLRGDAAAAAWLDDSALAGAPDVARYAARPAPELARNRD